MKTANEMTQTAQPVNQNDGKAAISAKFTALRKLTNEVRPFVKEGVYKNVNAAIIEMCYRVNGNETFKTFDQWKKDGFFVRKGEKAFVVWSRPITTQVPDAEKFYRIAFLFSNLQVVKKETQSEMAEEPPVKYGLAEIEVSYKPSKIELNPGKISSSRDVSELLRNFFSDFMEYREAFYALYLNRANTPIGIYQLSIGGQTGTVVDPKMIMQVAAKSHACVIILAHNHPSGNLQPSDADISLTKKIKKACEIFDIVLLDHIILTESSYFSFADDGKI